MPTDDSSDDFSQLPTVDGGGNEEPAAPDTSRPQPARRQQTRIGPRSAAPAQVPQEPSAEDAETEAAGGLSPEWQELLQEPVPAEASHADWDSMMEATHESSAELAPEAELAPAPAAQPRRTVIGRRNAAPEDTVFPQAAPRPLAPRALPPRRPENPSEAAFTPAPEMPSTPMSPWRTKWESWGGKAFTLSVAIHGLLFIAGAYYVISQVRPADTDYLPGGGNSQAAAAASASLEHKIQQKKSSWLKKSMPVQKLGALGSLSDIVLPEEVPDLMDLPQAADMFTGRKMAGLGLSAGSGGTGPSSGMGNMPGMVFQPFSMFGMQIKAKRLALIMDVSTSMYPHLPRVIEEFDKVAKGSPVILYFGCGLMPPPRGGIEGDAVYSTSGQDFEKFWRFGGVSLAESRSRRIDRSLGVPYEEIYRVLAKRPQTYFIHHVGTDYAWLALLNEKVSRADALYWFSDFQDEVDFRQLGIVRENLLNRKQRLYIHSYTRGQSYDLIRTQLVVPTSGDTKLEE